ncbi:MAG TPA: hypothetical protein PK797_14395 [Burkholderiaceae bacterium]|nr:hypothetical protein [Burkholderiaceae bacterium]
MTAPPPSGPAAGKTPARAAARAPLGGTFLSGAGGRLLPASLPLRFFGAAVVFHLLAWLVVLITAAQWPQWRGGLGPPLAALHLVTLGTLAASAIGASLQLLPVATRQPLQQLRLIAALWWVFVPGVALLTFGMGTASPVLLAAGAVAVIAALLVFGVLLGLNLRGARGMPGVVAHGWGAVAALLVLLGSAAALVALWSGHSVLDRDAARGLHLLAGVFGFMGLLALGLTHVLLPMFALGRVPPDREQLIQAALAGAAILAGGAAALGLGRPTWLNGAATVLGGAALALHLHLVRGVLATAMRSDLGRSGRLMRVGWAGLGLTLLLALVRPATQGDQPWGLLFGAAAVAGWLLTFLFGVLQRILPFLVSMHAAQGRRRPPTPAALTLELPLVWHLRCHLLALAALAGGLASGSADLIRLAGLVGALGAAAFALFFQVLMRRMRDATATPAGEPRLEKK